MFVPSAIDTKPAATRVSTPSIGPRMRLPNGTLLIADAALWVIPVRMVHLDGNVVATGAAIVIASVSPTALMISSVISVSPVAFGSKGFLERIGRTMHFKSNNTNGLLTKLRYKIQFV